MNRFNQFNISSPKKGFEGDKIKIDRILNREIMVHDYKVEPSKVKAFQDKGSSRCLHLQISVNNELHVVFTSSTYLIAMIEQVEKDKFPFFTTIVKDNDRLIFT